MKRPSSIKPRPDLAPGARSGVSRREAIVTAVASLAGVTEVSVPSLDRVIIVDGWVVKQSDLRDR